MINHPVLASQRQFFDEVKDLDLLDVLPQTSDVAAVFAGRCAAETHVEDSFMNSWVDLVHCSHSLPHVEDENAFASIPHEEPFALVELNVLDA